MDSAATTAEHELQASYLCIKNTLTDDLTTAEELKLALQCAGYNPIDGFIKENWPQNRESMTYREFVEVANNLPNLSMEDLAALFAKYFGADRVRESDFQTAVMKPTVDVAPLNIDDVKLLLSETGIVNHGFVDLSQLCHLVMKTAQSVKSINMQKMEEKSSLHRINSQTFTRKKRDKGLENVSFEDSSKLNDWKHVSLKGCFYRDKNIIMGHQYTMDVATSGEIIFKIVGNSEAKYVDMFAYLFRESADGIRQYVGFTDQRDSNGIYYFQQTLQEGQYLVIPHTSGCYLTERSSNLPGMTKLLEENLQKTPKVILSAEFRAILTDIFHQVDLDGNGTLNRQEFNLYNWRTSGEEVQDDEWAVVRQNFEVAADGQLTLAGFLALHQLEAEDNGGDVEDLWLTLEAVGYNRQGEQDQAAPFSLQVYQREASMVSLRVSGLKSGGPLLEKAIIRSVIERSEPVKIKNMEDLIKFTYVGEHWAAVVVQNKAHSCVTIRMDCSQSVNVISNQPALDWTMEVAGKSAAIAHQFIPAVEQLPWSVACNESLIK